MTQLFPDAVADVLRIFPGAKVIQLPRRCEHCSKSKELEGARHGAGMGGLFHELGRMGGSSWVAIIVEGRFQKRWRSGNRMKQAETLLLEIKILDDGAIMACRKDGKPLTNEDRAEARRLADSQPGITVHDVLRMFPGAKVISK